MSRPCGVSDLVRQLQADEQTRRLTGAVTGGVETLKQVLERLASSGIALVDVGLRRPTLDDVFLVLTGHAAEEVTEPAGAGTPDGAKPEGSDELDREVVP